MGQQRRRVLHCFLNVIKKHRQTKLFQYDRKEQGALLGAFSIPLAKALGEFTFQTELNLHAFWIKVHLIHNRIKSAINASHLDPLGEVMEDGKYTKPKGPMSKAKCSKVTRRFTYEISHQCSRMYLPECIFLCFVRWSCRMKVFPHSSHSYRLSSWWTLRWSLTTKSLLRILDSWRMRRHVCMGIMCEH